ncbi:MAG: DUF814 domain-containing protein [Nanoarchaeota archaeon]|nr:DUF814 domain-containing protein [Nanoarchaeota archaeon]
MKLILDPKKSIEENATIYYDKSKKAKRKLEGLNVAIENTNKKILKLDKGKPKEQKKLKDAPEKKWYMKFRYFTSSEGFLCIGGRDATTNDIIVKKHADKGDLVFHTEMRGSPFFIIKAEGKEIPQQTKEEAAIATAAFSRAWKEELGTAEVYSIQPDQVKKELGLPKGSFMIHGKREYYKPVIKLYVTLNKENYLECTPIKSELTLKFGGKMSDCAKKIKSLIAKKHEINYPLDEVIRILPGDCSIE